MKTSLDHLPAGKRRELARAVELIREGFAEAIKGRRAPRFKNGKLLKVILFGSYARGDWVEDAVGRYFSDFDLLVVVDHEDLADVGEFWLETEDRLREEMALSTLKTPISVIYHSLDDVNEKLELGRYFFIDMLRDGIMLFEEPNHPFTEPKPLTSEQALAETREHFEEWCGSASEFLETARFTVSRGWSRKAAFLFHQAAESFYHCMLLVRSLYSPKTHNLNRLRALSEDLEPRLKNVWPNRTKFDRRCYELIRAAYVKARYSRHYRITPDELAWLEERVALLQNTVREASLSRIAELEHGA
jgi:predicted nucleotidyltransferase/HEPN domain-containing protein